VEGEGKDDQPAREAARGPDQASLRDEPRRLATLGAGGAALAFGREALGQAPVGPSPVAGRPPAFRGQHAPRPLPFDPAKLKGLSEKLVRSHWENNYEGMHEHAYHMDYGAAAARYVDAFMENVRWDEVGRRAEWAQKATHP
jgi:Iron/manganese superoxide dismutases, C-terminal domain